VAKQIEMKIENKKSWLAFATN